MPRPPVSASRLTGGFLCWLAIADICIWLAHATNAWPYKVILFASLCLLPGAALLRAMRISIEDRTLSLLYSFGLSLLTIMLSGLAANQLLPAAGVGRPLDFWGAFGAWNCAALAIIIIGRFTNRQTLHLPILSRSHPSAYIAFFLSAPLPFLAVLGAFQLNNGGGPVLASITLGYGAILIAGLFILRRYLSDAMLAWCMFILGLSVLLMTSLRGWDIVGHDIAREFRVYSLTNLYGRWDISLFRDPYNACLSITILPQMLGNILHVSGITVFKLLLQIIFAACPAVLFVLLRRYVSPLGALTGCLLFVCYPTFITDSAMLTRQGIAYFFFALAIVVLSNKTQHRRYKLLFVLCSLGAVLSHYSTAYMFVGLFALAVIIKMAVTWHTGYRPWPFHSRWQPTVLSPLFAGLLLLMTFGWYARITETSGGLSKTVASSITSIPRLFSDDNKSTDVSAALLFSHKKTQLDLYNSYLLKTEQARAGGVVDLPVLTSDTMPLTPLGKKAYTAGIHPSIITTIRQNFAKVLQIMAVAGVALVAILLFRKHPARLSADFVYLNIASLALLSLMVLLPVLSVNYGILRAFQQALIFLVIPITMLLAWLSRPLLSWIRTGAAAASAVLLFLLFTGLFAQMLGGNSPSFSLNNSGLYYGLYYTPQADRTSFDWIKSHVSAKSDVRAANFNRALMRDPNYPFSQNGILPSQVKPNSLVYLDPLQVERQRLYTYYDSSPLLMTFPVEYYDLAKDRIYSTSSTRVYR